MNDMQELLNKAVRWDAAECLKALEIIQGHIRELDDEWVAKPHSEGLDPECAACVDEAEREAVTDKMRAFLADERFREATAHLPQTAANIRQTEAQDGLEEAVRRATEDVDAHEEAR